jgi:hypothetical protein
MNGPLGRNQRIFAKFGPTIIQIANPRSRNMANLTNAHKVTAAVFGAATLFSLLSSGPQRRSSKKAKKVKAVVKKLIRAVTPKA